MIKKSKIIKLASILLIAINILTFTSVKADGSFSGVTEATLKEKIMPLKTVVEGNGFEDMQGLKEILKDKKIVSMGEATHGTKEFFQMKHRMFEFLVEEMGYRLFAIEDSFGAGEIVNDYVLYGKGNVKEVIHQLDYGTWQTEEVETFVEWMRVYNKNPAHKTKVKFYGFDMQGPKKNGIRVSSYIDKVDKSLVKLINNFFREFSAYNISELEHTKYVDKGFLAKRQELKDIISLFDKNKELYVSRSSLNEYKLAYHNLINALQFTETTGRDESMCDNVKWILDYEKQFGNDKIMLWSHNFHASSDPCLGSMGSQLKYIYEDEMYSIGFEFYDGNFRGNSINGGMKKMECLKPYEGTFPDLLNRANEALYFMDFKSASTNNEYIKEWLSTGQRCHYFDAISYDENGLSFGDGYLKPMNTYDGIIFVRNTTAAIGDESIIKTPKEYKHGRTEE